MQYRTILVAATLCLGLMGAGPCGCAPQRTSPTLAAGETEQTVIPLREEQALPLSGQLTATPSRPVEARKARDGQPSRTGSMQLDDYREILEDRPLAGNEGGVAAVPPMRARGVYDATDASLARQQGYLNEARSLGANPPEKPFTDTRRIYENSFKSRHDQMASPRYHEDRLQMSRMESGRR